MSDAQEMDLPQWYLDNLGKLIEEDQSRIDDDKHPPYTPAQLFARARLEHMGVYVRALCEGVFFPPSYRLRYGSISVDDVSWDAAVLRFIEELLKHVSVEEVIEEESPDLVVERMNRIELPGYNELGEDEPMYMHLEDR
jgi:hypothetical protein